MLIGARRTASVRADEPGGRALVIPESSLISLRTSEVEGVARLFFNLAGGVGRVVRMIEST